MNIAISLLLTMQILQLTPMSLVMNDFLLLGAVIHMLITLILKLKMMMEAVNIQLLQYMEQHYLKIKLIIQVLLSNLFHYLEVHNLIQHKPILMGHISSF